MAAQPTDRLDMLERHYHALLGLQNQSTFFLGFTDYFDHAATIPTFVTFVGATLSSHDVWGNDFIQKNTSVVEGGLAQLIRLYDMICFDEGRRQALVKVENGTDPGFLMQGETMRQWREIRSGGRSDISMFRVDQTKALLTRLHTKFLASLLENTDDQKRLHFDPKLSRLYVRGYCFQIRRRSDQYDALRVIFADLKLLGQEWFLDDVAEQVDVVRPNERVKKYYNAFYQIGRKVAAKGFPEFIITKTHSARINPRYLS